MLTNIINMNNQMMNNQMMNNNMMNNNMNDQMMNNNMMNNNMNNPMMSNMNNMNNMQNQMMMNNMQNQMMMNNMQIPMNQMASNGMNIMNQNLFNNNQSQGNNNQPQQSNGFLTVNFRDSGNDNNQNTEGYSIAIQCKPDEKVSDIIQRYRTKANFYDEAKFVFNAKNLAPSLTVAEAGISHSSKIFVVRTKHVKGAYYFFFI